MNNKLSLIRLIITNKRTNQAGQRHLGINDEYERAAAFEQSIRITGWVREQIDLSGTVVHLERDEGAAGDVLEIRLCCRL